MYKAPRDKLVCILNCCKVISNLLLNASVASNENPPGADEFLPVLIYVTMKVRSVIYVRLHNPLGIISHLIPYVWYTIQHFFLEFLLFSNSFPTCTLHRFVS